MKEKFRDKKFAPRLKVKLTNGNIWEADIQSLLYQIDSIVTEYSKQNITLTLRQLYYQLVATDVIPNDVKAYDKIGVLLTDARYNGLVDWEAIEDRARIPQRHSEWDSVLDLVESAIYGYRLPRWKDQDYYVELFTEKDALSSVLSPIANKWHIYFCVNRGYSSASAMYDLGKRVGEQLKLGKKVVLLYLGDHDPSGLDMLRDINERTAEFLTQGEEYIEPKVQVIPIALTMEQIKKYNPPPNPAKIADPRAKWYIETFGPVSWEVDALKPNIMIGMVDSFVEKFVQKEKWNRWIEKENIDKKKLKEYAKTITVKEEEVVEPYKFDRDDLRTEVYVKKRIAENKYEYEREDIKEFGKEYDYRCPVCDDQYFDEIEDCYYHIFDDHTEEEFNEAFNK